ncbi:MAG TPA: hypothetical protein PLJ44_11690 [Victivallales bacterium]|mgnify:CR=1 FL=1|nr:hypothetical protein [Victivallales bacterium]
MNWIERCKQKWVEKRIQEKVNQEDLIRWANSEDYIDKINKVLLNYQQKGEKKWKKN